MKARTYETPAAFKRALEDRLKAGSKTGVDFARRRQLVVFDRFLARVVATFGDAAILKGGLARAPARAGAHHEGHRSAASGPE